jgi:adenylyltransferase/sulfurtransferase
LPKEHSGQPVLPAEEIRRYSRHLTLPEMGMEGQLALRRASVAVVGAGGLGCPAVLYLAAAGVGRIGLIDDDLVELTNLQRQVLYRTDEVGRSKVEMARHRAHELNPHVEVVRHETRLVAENAMELLRAYDIVLDCSDNFSTRYLVNDSCVLLGKPDVYGSVYRFEGQASVFWGARGPCYRCLFPTPPPAGAVPDCAEGGILGVLPGIVGTLQATEAIKLILGRGEPLVGRLLHLNALEMEFRSLALRKNPACPACGEHPTILAPADETETCAPGDAGPYAGESTLPNLDVAHLQQRLELPEPPTLLDVRTPMEWGICRLPGARLIPLDALISRLDELNRDEEIVVYCHVGIRSALAVRILGHHGFSRASNLLGGIDAWAAGIDPTMARY